MTDFLNNGLYKSVLIKFNFILFSISLLIRRTEIGNICSALMSRKKPLIANRSILKISQNI